jgi:hypothetical protein
MSEFAPVVSAADLDALDVDEIVAGYWAGSRGQPEPGNDKSRAFWHGWRNGATDFGHRQMDEAQARLAAAVYGPTRRAGMN